MKYSVLWMTTQKRGLPHEDQFSQYNPDVRQYVCEGVDVGGIGEWRNNDRALREWLKKNLHLIDTPYLIIIEWDVLFGKKVEDVFSEFEGVEIGGLHKKPNQPGRWQWFQEVPHLPEGLRSYAAGIAPFCLMCIGVDKLKQLCSKAFDNVFNKDIFCELRFATVLNFMGVNVRRIECKTRITSLKIRAPLEGEGIWHAVKKKQNNIHYD